MSYLQPEGAGRNKLTSWALVLLVHLVFGYVVVSGLAIKAVQQITGPLEAVQIEDAAPPPVDEPPPPPPQLEEVPPFVPPPDVVVQQAAPPPPTIVAQTQIRAPEPVRVVPPAPPAPVAPPAPPPAPPEPRVERVAAQPIARTFEVSEDDYPDASRRAGEEGTTGVRVTIGTNGRVTSCEVVQSSGHSRLDQAACRIAERRWRFRPATENGQPVESTLNRTYRWQLQDGRR